MNKINIFLSGFLMSLCIIILFIIFPINKSYVKIHGQVFFVDVAKTQKQKALGLDIYKKLPLNKGMIFIMGNTDYHQFWMKGMKFPIDIIYINNNKIVDIFENLPAPVNENDTPVIVTPKQKANYVLEINAGLSKKYNIKTGDVIEIRL